MSAVICRGPAPGYSQAVPFESGGSIVLTPETTVRDIVAEDFRAAAVFEKHGIDFCCGGDRPLGEVCRERGLALDEVMEALASARAGSAPEAPRFATWDAPALVSYIVDNHHSYVRSAIPPLLQHTRKVEAVHGDRHPELHHVADIFAAVADEMGGHMFKEERILFPFIVAMAEAAASGQPMPAAPFGTVENPIRMMEHEHESAGSGMARIKELTGGYRPPADGCATYRVCLEELKAFEADLHRHVHLENNILFPKARALEAGG
jgi:regulator of cell morphogenesis and NO signaling